ncbi:hypothetical protein AYI68_g8286 [Smittium mucronatum]|uniref:Uncharacterized protein n=1 Tax=Smittium mucronatum TaxID=133383 RepID=A0A1R0GLB8_9FUNG|nr:hypothetical protein AYI68_g8286 [Smittium mucronatum]
MRNISTYRRIIMPHRPENSPVPKAREMGYNLAAEAGAPVDKMLSHEFLSSYSILDSYYHLSRFTNLI